MPTRTLNKKMILTLTVCYTALLIPNPVSAQYRHGDLERRPIRNSHSGGRSSKPDYNPWIGLGVRLLENEIRKGNRSNNDRGERRPPGRTPWQYGRRTNSPPVVTTPTPPKPYLPPNTVPKNVMPRNTVPSQDVTRTAPGNFSLTTTIPQLSERDQNRLQQRVEDLVQDDLKELKEISSKIIDGTNKSIDKNLNEMPQADRESLKLAISRGDKKGVQKILDQYRDPITGQVQIGKKTITDADFLMNVADVVSAQQNLSILNRNGASYSELTKAVADLERELDGWESYLRSNPGGLYPSGFATALLQVRQDFDKKLGKLKTSVDLADVLSNQRGRNQGGAGRGSSLTDLLQYGLITLIRDPGLGRGQRFVYDRSLVVGTGRSGQFEVGQSTPADALGIPTSDDAPVDGGGDVNDWGVTLENPAANGGQVAFLLDGQTHSLPAGESKTYYVRHSHVIEFDQGGNQGSAQFTLKTAKTYKFAVVDGIWKLRQRTYSVVLDNTANEHDFHYLADDKVQSVKAGSKKTHEGDAAIKIEFDRGDGKPSEKTLKSGEYRVGVDPQKGVWDLFPEETVFDNEPESESSPRVVESGNAPEPLRLRSDLREGISGPLRFYD